MNAIQQRCRPKHQVLVLKCYPRTTKGAVDVKPNSSELSYLLFYATSRRSKIQKVGNFLEKKTASDVWRLRIGNVQVTLQILAALIEKSPKDLPLFANNVLAILDQVLRSNDITMVEASLPTFETFCDNHDGSSLFADQAYLHKYELLVRTYASFASTRHQPQKGQSPPSKPLAMRWRNAGLEAIKSVARSEALSSVAGRQLDVIVPVILENLWTDNDEFLQTLVHRQNHAVAAAAAAAAAADPNDPLRRRPSVSTVKTDGTADANPIAISGSSGDIDKLAEEDIGVTALDCLKDIFVVPNRAQIHSGTLALLQFIHDRVADGDSVFRTHQSTGRDSGWAITIFSLLAGWAPVQDRYIILVTTMDRFVRMAPAPDNVSEQTAQVAIMASLLRSDINLIGLSIMDVLLGLLQQTKRILRNSAAGHRNGTANGTINGNGSASAGEKLAPNTASSDHMATPQKELLNRIQTCIGDLATHIYYADQIPDMVAAILMRLRPHPGSPAAAAAVNSSPPAEKAEPPAAHPMANSSDDLSSLESFFTNDLAKITALKAVKSILLVANPKSKISGNVSLTRNKVPVQVWEGTQWLLRDADGQVRKAYADALITWLDRETTKADLRARDETSQKTSRADEQSNANVARRAVSSASARKKPTKPTRSRFLQLLHLAIYDNALQYIDYETDCVLLHILLTKLASKLGVNAVRYGLPMIFRLQEDIQEVETPLAKVRLGCLCHGYFWAVSEVFGFESSPVGQAIQGELVRRRSKQFWIEGVQVPPPPLELAGTPGLARPQPRMPLDQMESESLLPFDERALLVDSICTNYQDSPASPAGSPPASPSRNFSQPLLSSPVRNAHPPVAAGDFTLPPRFKEEMLFDWSRETTISNLQEGAKSASLSGSKTGASTSRGNRLTVEGITANGNSPSRPGSTGARHSGVLLGPVAALRNSSVPSRGSVKSGSSRGVVASVDQLKSVLSGDQARPPTFRTIPDDNSSESMASCDFSPSELSFNPAAAEDGEAADGSLARTRSKSRERKGSGDTNGPLSSNPTEGDDVLNDGEPVPPVPPLPEGVAGKSPTIDARPALPQATRDTASRRSNRNASGKSRGGESLLSSSFADAGAASLDLQAMLKGIDSRARDHGIGNLTKPPY